MATKRICDFCDSRIDYYTGENRLRLRRTRTPHCEELERFEDDYPRGSVNDKDACSECAQIIKHMFAEGFEEIPTALKKQPDTYKS